MADNTSSAALHGATSELAGPSHTPPSMRGGLPEPSDAIAITRSFQSAVLRLRWTLAAMKYAADGEHENPQQPPLFWPDLIDALVVLTPDANLLDVVVDELRLPLARDPVISS